MSMKISAKATVSSILVVMAMMVIACGPAEQKPPVKSKSDLAEERKTPQITWRDIAYIDTIQAGDTIVRDYIFYNTGWKPVVIKHAIPNRPECTCRIPSKEILIGDQDTVQLRCFFKDYEPRATVEIIVEHNTPQPSPVLVFMGTMLED